MPDRKSARAAVRDRTLSKSLRLGLTSLLLVMVGLYSRGLLSQEIDIQSRLDKLRENPVFRQLMEQSQGGLTETQKRLLDKAVDGLTPDEVDETLKSLNLSTEGDAPARKERLRVALGISARPEFPEKKKAAAIAIENAAEGEFMRGEDDSSGLMILRGRIRLRLPQGVAYADTVIVDTKRQEIFAEGNLVYEKSAKDGKGDGQITAERLLYDQKLGTGILYNADGFLNPVRFIGQSLQQIGDHKISVSHVYFTTCAAKVAHYNFTARKLWVYEDQKIVAVGVLTYVGGIPLLPIPFLYASPWGTGVITQMGHGNIQGYFMQNTYQFSVPDFYTYDFLPIGYKFKADIYENTGHSFGADFFRFGAGVNYFLELGASEYHRYEVIPDFRERRGVRFTNQVTHSDGTMGKEYLKWYKIFAILNSRSADFKKNNVRNIQLRFEDYTHRFYDFEFGGRYEPTSTLPALYKKGEAERGLIHNDTNWNLVYNETFDDFNVRVQASRIRTWLEAANVKDSKYVPVTDVVPTVDLKKKWMIGRLPYFDSPFIWENKLHSDLTRQYSGGIEFQTKNYNQFTSGFRTYVTPFQYITFQPFVGYGAQKTVPYAPTRTAYTTTGPVSTGGVTSTDFKAFEREAARQSYQFLFTEDELVTGPDLIFLRTTYRKKESFKEEEKDAPAVNVGGFSNNQKVHEVEGSLEAYPFDRLGLSVTSIYDLRKYQFDVKPKERWYYPVARLDYYLDFINFFRDDRENLLTRRKAHFLGTRFTNDYVYDPFNKRDHSNVFGVSFEAGGFDLWLLRRLRFFEMGYYWYHVYYNPELDHMRFSLKNDLQILRWLFLELELESRATEPQRYRKDSRTTTGDYNYVSFPQDTVDGSGLAGTRRRQNAAFNLASFEGALIMDLHDFEFRFGYRMEQRSTIAGTGSVEAVTYYDNKVFFSLTLMHFDIGNNADRPSRFILDRRRVRPQDIGRLPVQSTRLN